MDYEEIKEAIKDAFNSGWTGGIAAGAKAMVSEDDVDLKERDNLFEDYLMLTGVLKNL